MARGSIFGLANGAAFGTRGAIAMRMSSFKKLARDQQGLSTLEYTILFVIIVVGALSLWSKLGQPVP